MTRTCIAGAILVVLALALPMCSSVPMTAPANADLTLIANPTFVAANGGVSVVTAVVIEPAGTPVPNGTVIFFLTDLGRVDAQAKTKDGFARVNFVSDSRSGTANVQAFSGGPATNPTPGPSASPSPTTFLRILPWLGLGIETAHADPNHATVAIKVGSALPTRVLVVASPARITSPRSALITANVLDGNGNPIANVPVIFTVSASPLEEGLDSGSVAQFTDTNGQAFDTLRTRRPLGSGQKVATVTATSANGVEGTVAVAID